MQRIALALVMTVGCTDEALIDSGEPLEVELAWTARIISSDTAPTLVTLPYPEEGFEVWGAFSGHEEPLLDHFVAVDGLLCEWDLSQEGAYNCDPSNWWMLAAYDELTIYSYEAE